MNLNSFMKSLKSNGIKLTVSDPAQRNSSLGNEALFQLPLISMVIMLMAKSKRKPMVAEIGQLVGEALEASFQGFKGSAQHIGWSANLRIRTVTALSFLERKELVFVDNRKGRIRISDVGRRVIDRALNSNSDLSYNLHVIARSYRNICVSRQLDLELT